MHIKKESEYPGSEYPEYQVSLLLRKSACTHEVFLHDLRIG
jgi:hypothetical protein